MSDDRITRVNLNRASRRRGKTEWQRLQSMSDADSRAAALADADNPPLTQTQRARLEPIPDVKAIRERLGLTQQEFARTYRLSLAAVRDWEQKRYQPDRAARTLLQLIAAEPAVIAHVLTADKRTR